MHAVTQEETRASLRTARSGRDSRSSRSTSYIGRRACGASSPNQSSIGVMHDDDQPQPATDGLSFLPDSAVTGGVDCDWRFGKRYALTGYWAGSRVRGIAEAIDGCRRTAVH